MSWGYKMEEQLEKAQDYVDQMLVELKRIEERLSKIEENMKIKPVPEEEEYYICNGCGRYDHECICDLYDDEDDGRHEMTFEEIEDLWED